MIKINGVEYQYSRFPNGEIKFPEIPAPESIADLAHITADGDTIDWVFENNEEFFVIQILVKELKDKGRRVNLHMPFCPYGQQDRKMPGQLFSFKYFAQMLNDMDLDRVMFIDPHSLVMNAAIKHSLVRYLDLRWTQSEKYDLLFYPDNGAAKKYSEVYPGQPYRFGNKKRNLETGEILKYEVIADKSDIEGKQVLIVDDLCMGGRTFREAAKALKELGAKSVGLQITHFMPESVMFLSNFKESGIDDIYTYFDGISQIPLRQFEGCDDCLKHGIHAVNFLI
jgi:ribose-phosphate pyrophosphokinase